MAANKKQLPPPAGAGPAAVMDPKFEWEEKTGSYVLRLALPALKKDDFRVQVDGTGRLTVRATKPAATGQGSFHDKVFQLPSAASLDDIAGRFADGVLTLTAPKRASSATAPTSIEEIKKKQPGVGREENKVAKEEMGKEDLLKSKAMDEAKKAQQQKLQQEKRELEAMSRKQEQQKPEPSPVKKEGDVTPKAPQAAAAAPPEKAAHKPDGATSGEKAKPAIAPESLAERLRRRGEEEQRTKAAAAATAKEAKAEQEKKAMAVAAWGSWKERVAGELKVLTDMKWADGMVETARKNKEVVAVGIAAFSLGFLVSQKLFRK